MREGRGVGQTIADKGRARVQEKFVFQQETKYVVSLLVVKKTKKNCIRESIYCSSKKILRIFVRISKNNVFLFIICLITTFITNILWQPCTSSRSQ